jgi:hypothetical protein
MTIAKRNNGSYTVRYDGDRIDGKRNKITVGTFPTKKEAQRAYREALQNKDRGIDLDPERIDVATLLDRYMQDRTDRGRGAKTVERYGELASLYLKPHMGTIAVAKLKPAHVTELLALLRKQGGAKGRPLSPGSVRHAFVLLNGALGWAVRNELVSRNVAKGHRTAVDTAYDCGRALGQRGARYPGCRRKNAVGPVHAPRHHLRGAARRACRLAVG